MKDSEGISNFERTIEDNSNLIDKLQDAIVLFLQQADPVKNRIYS
jgi:hypothetical protein